jgi:hypothetical protein
MNMQHIPEMPTLFMRTFQHFSNLPVIFSEQKELQKRREEYGSTKFFISR